MVELEIICPFNMLLFARVAQYKWHISKRLLPF